MYRLQREYEKKLKENPNSYEIIGGNMVARFLVGLIIFMGVCIILSENYPL